MLNVAVLDNPSPFGNPFQFEITFECMEDLPEGKCFFFFVYVSCLSEAKVKLSFSLTSLTANKVSSILYNFKVFHF